MKKLAFLVCLTVAALSFVFANAAVEPSKLDLKCGKLEGVLQIEDHEYAYFIDNQNVTVKYTQSQDEQKHIQMAADTTEKDSVCIGLNKADQKNLKPVFSVGKNIEEAKKAAQL